MSNDGDIGTAIVWTVVSMSRQKAEYLVKEFSDELKRTPMICQECSRWCHQLQDLSRCTLSAIRDHVVLKPETERILLSFRTSMGEFVKQADEDLGVRSGRPISTATREPLESVRLVVAAARELVLKLSERLDELSRLLPGS